MAEGKGLDEFFSVSSPAPEAPKASPEPKAEPEKTDAPAEAKPAEEVKAEPAAEAKPEDKPKAEAEPEKVAAKPEEKPPEDKKAETPPKSDWDSDENPYKKRYADTRDWATRVNSDAAEARRDAAENKRQLEIVNAKLDGTYDEAKFKQPEPTAAELQGEAEIKGKIKASEHLAYQLHGGKEKVDAQLKVFDEKFGKNQFVQYRVLNSDAPIIEALNVMDELAIVEEYGSDKPREIIKAVEKKYDAKMRAEITEEITKKLMARLDKKESLAPSLTDVRGAGKDDGKKATGPVPLNQLFSQ